MDNETTFTHTHTHRQQQLCSEMIGWKQTHFKGWIYVFLSVFFTQKYLHVTKVSAAADKKKSNIYFWASWLWICTNTKNTFRFIYMTLENDSKELCLPTTIIWFFFLCFHVHLHRIKTALPRLSSLSTHSSPLPSLFFFFPLSFYLGHRCVEWPCDVTQSLAPFCSL